MNTSIKRGLICIVTFFVTMHNYAQNIELIETVDGSQYYGYIKEQVPGQNVVIRSDKSILYLENNKLENVSYNTKQISEFSNEIQEYLMQEGFNGDVNVASFVYNGIEFNETINLLKGDSKSKFVVFSSLDYNVLWNELLKTKKIYNDSETDTLIEEIIETINGSLYKGRVIEQCIGTYISIEDSTSKVVKLDISEVKSIKTLIADNKSELWRSIPLLDVISLDNGDEIKGFIEERVMGECLRIQDLQGTVKEIALHNIQKYGKIINPEFGCSASLNAPYINVNGKNVSTTSLNSDGKRFYVTSEAEYISSNDGYIIVEINKYNIAEEVKLYSVKDRVSFKETKDILYSCVPEIIDNKIKIEISIGESGCYFLAINRFDGLFLEISIES